MPNVTPIQERLSWLRKEREHCSVCEGCATTSAAVDGRHRRQRCQCFATATLYCNGNAGEFKNNALALAWELGTPTQRALIEQAYQSQD